MMKKIDLKDLFYKYKIQLMMSLVTFTRNYKQNP